MRRVGFLPLVESPDPPQFSARASPRKASQRNENEMGKFAGAAPAAPLSILRTVSRTPDTVTFEGGAGHTRDAKSDLFLLAVTNMVGEQTFYESTGQRDARFEGLVHEVTVTDPGWMQRFVPWLRTGANMRSASVVAACEYVKAGGPNGRRVIDAACQRPDEPAEILGYWLATHGRRLPAAVKRGVADAVVRLYTERAFLKYDSQRSKMRMADVVELVHPVACGQRQSDLFKHMLDDRHHPGGDMADALGLLRADRALLTLPEDMRRAVLHQEGVLDLAGWTWERLAGWLPGGMDAEGWEAAIPRTGVMALIRNLRNFDAAKISEAAIDQVIAKITNADEVKRSRIFPYRVWAAYREAPSDNWKRALAKTLDLTASNIPALDRTLVLIDTSGSMQSPVSGKSKMHRVEVASLMAWATAHRAKNVDVVIFGQDSMMLVPKTGYSTLTAVDETVRLIGKVGHSTMGHTAIRAHWDAGRHDRVVLFTDDQMADSGVDLSHIPTIYTFNLAGYAPSSLPSGERGRYTFGGFNDAGFSLIETLEARRDGGWPF